jgi:uncharacterized protein
MNVLVKGTQECNLDCSYCFDREKREDGRITLEDIEALCRKDTDKDIHHWTWFGGEPMLLGVDFYRKAMTIVKKYYEDPSFTMQTNLTLLNDEWIALAKEFNMGFGISFDGVKNEQTRGVKVETLKNKIKMLRENGLKAGTIAVVNEVSAKHLVENYVMMKAAGVTSIAFNRVFSSHRSNALTEKTNKEYLESFKALLEYWAQDKEPITIRQISNLLETMLTEKNKLSCTYGGRCEDGIFAINQHGQIEPCDRWFPEEYKNPKTIHEYKNLKEAFQTEEYKRLAKVSNLRKQEFCKGCFMYEYCHGGCPANAVFYSEGLKQNENDCRLYQYEFNLMFNKVKDMYPKDTVNPNLQRMLQMHRPLSLIKEVLTELEES